MGRKRCVESTQAPFRKWLSDEFMKAKERNSRTSMRSFSKKLGMCASVLCEVMHGHRSVTERFIKRTIESYNINVLPVIKEMEMLTFSENEKKIKQSFCFAAGSISQLIQYKQIQDWLQKIGMKYEDLDSLDLILSKFKDCIVKDSHNNLDSKGNNEHKSPSEH